MHASYHSCGAYDLHQGWAISGQRATEFPVARGSIQEKWSHFNLLRNFVKLHLYH